VQFYAESQGFSVIRALVGHGVGRELHEDPYIPNFSSPKSPENNVVLKEGMTLALEPMINVGDYNIKLDKDGWVYRTSDGKLSAHFEDTVLITKDGAEILTRE
jgi:methionyl aminopeptidase